MIKKVKKFLILFSVPILITIFVILQLTVIKMNLVDYIICLSMMILVHILAGIEGISRIKESYGHCKKVMDDIIDLSLKTINELKEREEKLERDVRYYKEKCKKLENDLISAKNK